MEAAVLLAYLLGVVRLSRGGRVWPAGRSVAFICGLATLWLAAGSGLAAYDDSNGAVHLLQHLLLMMVGPPLLALGRPLVLAAQVLPRRAQSRLARVVNHRALGSLMHPAAAGALYFGAMYTFMLGPFYGWAQRDQLLHDSSHLLFALTGYLYWQPLVDPTGRHRLSAPVRLIVVMASGPVEAGVGIALAARGSPLPGTTLGLTRAGGHLFLAGSMLVSGLWVLFIAAGWLGDSRRRTPREDRRAESIRLAAGARAGALGLEPAPPGWTIPDWRLVEAEGAPPAPSAAVDMGPGG